MSSGIIMFNRGDKCIVRAVVCLYTLRKYYEGPITFYLEEPYPHEFDEVCKSFECDLIHNDKKHELATLVRKTDMFGNPPYDKTMWLDSDMIILDNIDKMFELLDDTDVVIPHWCMWLSNGKALTKRINRFKGIAEEKHMEEALKEHPAVNTGILSFKKSEKWRKFVEDWVVLADKGSKKGIFIPDEVAFQILYPSIQEWGLNIKIAPQNYNVSVRYGESVEDKKVIHFHGQKHLWMNSLGQMWKDTFKEMTDQNIADINSLIQYSDKRLTKYIKNDFKVVEDPPRQPRKKRNRGEKMKNKTIEIKPVELVNGLRTDTTIVTACDSFYVDILRETFPNWRKYKNIDTFPVIVFVHGIPLNDSRLDFLKLPNVKLVDWKMDNVDGNHREEMLSAFVFGAAEHVKTDYWLKLDADSYATDNRPLFKEEYKKYGFFGQKWGYSRPEHIRKLDEWAKGHWMKKLKNSKPMIEEGKIEGNRFYHNVKRTISFIQLHQTKFTRFCVKMLKERRLPAPTQDTFMFFLLHKLDPHLVGIGNFKREHGFTQGRGKLGAEHIREQVKKIDETNTGKVIKEQEEVENNELDYEKDYIDIDSDDENEENNEIENIDIKKEKIITIREVKIKEEAKKDNNEQITLKIPYIDKNGNKVYLEA